MLISYMTKYDIAYTNDEEDCAFNGYVLIKMVIGWFDMINFSITYSFKFYELVYIYRDV